MERLEELYREFATLATVRIAGGRPPTSHEIERVAAAIGLPVPDELVAFWQRFPDRHPPFWDVLRPRTADHPADVGRVDDDDLVWMNLDQRSRHPDELERCLLFFNTGWGGHDCFVFDDTGRPVGIGTWSELEGPRGEPPSVSCPGWEEWFAGQMKNLRP